ncbi:MAG: hypothetical protein ACYC9Y_15850, partial [Candidatus Methylomirabilia bacterium]
MPRTLLRVALLLGIVLAGEASSPPMPSAGVISPGVTVRAEGRAPVLRGRVDTAYRQALDEAFRRGLLEALRVLAPERQSPQDLETWQDTILSRAVDFVGAWRILAQEQQDGFLTLSVEIEIYSDKLARAARATGVATAAAAVRVMVLAGSLPMIDRAADEELDAGRTATIALEAELARRGAIIVATTDRVPWEQSSGPPSEENRVALAASAGKKLDADAVLILQLTRRGEGLALDAQLIATASETTLASTRVEVQVLGGRSLAEAFAQA